MPEKTEHFAKAKSHQEYFTSDGRPAVGVTTALKVLDKPALMYWAWNLGKQGIDLRKHVDILAEIGTIAHGMILADLANEKFDADEYSPKQVDLAENSFLSYLNWRKKHTLEPVRVEEAIVSDKHAFGGTPDYYGLVDGALDVIDFKTGKRIYDDHFLQASAYKGALIENGFPVEGATILNIPRANTEEFDEKRRTELEDEYQIFLHALAIYRLKRKK